MQHTSVHTVALKEHPEVWDRLHAVSANATVFSSTKWLLAMAEAFQRRTEAFVIQVGDAPVAGIPLLVHRRGPLRIAAPLPISLYAGFLQAADVLPLDQLLEHVEKRFHFISLSASLPEQYRRTFGTRGWWLRRQQTIRLDVSDMQSVWNGYAQSLRRKLRRAEEASFQLDNDPPTVEIVRMFEQSYLRHGNLPPIPGTIITPWLNLLRQRGIARCFAARHPDGRCAAVRVVVAEGGTLYDWLAGADPSVAPSASHWLLHSVIAWHSARDFQLFDFMGANTPGVTDFKRSFGGYEYEYYEADWYRPAFLRHLNAIRSKRLRVRRGFR